MLLWSGVLTGLLAVTARLPGCGAGELPGRPSPALRRSISELEGTRLGSADSPAADRREWLEVDVRMEVLETIEDFDTTDELLEVEERTGPPRDKDFSRKV